MEVHMSYDGIERVQKYLDRLSGPVAREAMATAINDTAFHVRRTMQSELRSVFDRPTNYILSSPRVLQATPDKLTAIIAPTYLGGKGIDPQRILDAQTIGGVRSDKRSEVAFKRAGILPDGYQTVLPSKPFPGSDDGRGNLKGSFATQLISYFQAFGEQGYRANMTAKRKQSIHSGSKNQAGRRYFVSYGRLRDANKTRHLAPGIWAASGEYDAVVQPVLMFVKRAKYRARLSMATISHKANANDYLARRLRFRIRQAAGV